MVKKLWLPLKDGNFYDKLNNYQILKRGSASRSWLEEAKVDVSKETVD
jgi:hypothetical protein